LLKHEPAAAVARLNQLDLVAGGVGVLLAPLGQGRAAGTTPLGADERIPGRREASVCGCIQVRPWAFPGALGCSC
jgi:hypothetical protein